MDLMAKTSRYNLTPMYGADFDVLRAPGGVFRRVQPPQTDDILIAFLGGLNSLIMSLDERMRGVGGGSLHHQLARFTIV